MTTFAYVGSELPLFAQAKNWKSYWRSHVAPWLGDTVLEVGAGIGGTTELLCQRSHARWVCLEPDAALADQLQAKIRSGSVPACCQVKVGVIADLEPDAKFDTIIYIDVLEHIEGDQAELQRAADRLNDGGVVIVLSPAHPWLFSEFDQAVGHYRRYTRRMLDEAMPRSLKRIRLIYLDSVGMLASAANRLLLRCGHPTAQQIGFWDRVLVRLSRVADPLLGCRVGKSVLGIYQKPAPGR